MFYIIEFYDNVKGQDVANQLVCLPNGTIIQSGVYINIRYLHNKTNGLVRIIWFDDKYVNDERFNWFLPFYSEEVKRFEKININKSINDDDWIWDDDWLMSVFGNYI